jgi:hypothetical protein
MISKVKFKQWNCTLNRSRYMNGRLALYLTTPNEGRIAICTTNLPNEPLAPDEVFIKDYSENEGMLDALAHAGVISAPPILTYTQSGHVRIPKVKILLPEPWRNQG